MLKSNSGITLVALVVTIIVLLILAAATISLVLGQNGILNRATKASKEQTAAYVKETIENALKAAEVDYYANTTAYDIDTVYAMLPTDSGGVFAISGSNITYTKNSVVYTATISDTTFTVTNVSYTP